MFMKTYFYSFIVAILLGTPVSAQTDIDICDLSSFSGLSYMRTITTIDSFVQNTSRSEVMHNTWLHLRDSISGSHQRRQIYTEILDQPCDAEGNTPLHLAIKAIEGSLAIGIDSSNLLHRLMKSNPETPELALINALVNRHASVDAINENEETPLDMVRVMMQAEDFSNDKMDLYAFIYQQNKNSLTDRQQHHNIFQRICRSRYNSYLTQKLPTNETPSNSFLGYTIERSNYELMTDVIIMEYNQWLSILLEIEKLPALMEVYQTLRRTENITSSDLHSIPISTEARRRQLVEDDLRCSGRTSRYYGL